MSTRISAAFEDLIDPLLGHSGPEQLPSLPNHCNCVLAVFGSGSTIFSLAELKVFFDHL